MACPHMDRSLRMTRGGRRSSRRMWTYGVDGSMAPRIGFAVDVVGYSGRPHVVKVDAQRRVLAMVEGMIAGVGADSAATDRQPSGDGVMVFLPASVPPPSAGRVDPDRG